MDLLHKLFSDRETEIISLLPNSKIDIEGTLVWHFGKHWCCTVKGGYRLLASSEQTLSQIHIINQSTDYSNFFKKTVVGSATIKSQNTCLENLHSILPTITNLRSRQTNVEATCSRCSEEEETTLHAMRDCRDAQLVWESIGWVWSRNSLGDENMKNWLLVVLQSANFSQLQYFLLTLWTIWGSRNQEFHEGIRTNSQEEVRFIKAYLEEFISA